MLSNTQQPSVLFFDSGVGGLSVYQQTKALLPDFNYIYLFDNQGYPYGELEPDVLIRRCEKLIQHIVDRHTIDLVVVACNTASTIVLPALRRTLSIPVVGVVPAIKPAAAIARKGIGLIATPGTVQREYTHQLIEQFSAGIPVELIGSTEMVNMAENKLRGEEVDLNKLKQILKPLINNVDVAVLGCTHFPLIQEEISQVLGKEVALVDSGCAIARRVNSLLSDKTVLTPLCTQSIKGTQNIKGIQKIYASAAPVKETALNSSLIKFGFEPIETLPNLDV